MFKSDINSEDFINVTQCFHEKIQGSRVSEAV